MAVRMVMQAFKKYPLLVNAGTYGGLYVAGDITQQTLRGVEKYDWKNTRNIGIITGGIIGPVIHYWYIWLDKVLPGTAKKVVLRKLLMDQSLAMPIVFTFFAGLSLLEGKTNIFKEAIEKTPKTFLTGCLFWPPVQCVNFFLLPTRYRAIYVGVAAYIWSIILCFIKAVDAKKIKLPVHVKSKQEE